MQNLKDKFKDGYWAFLTAHLVSIMIAVLISISIYHYATPRIVTADISLLIKERTLRNLNQDKKELALYIANLEKLCDRVAKENNLIIIIKQASIAGEFEDITSILRQGIL